jgi:hypothetical protein
MDDPDKRLKKAVEDSLEIIGDYIQPGERDCETTLNKLSETLDNREVQRAVEQSEKQEAQKDDGRRSEKARSGRPEPDQHKRGMGT